MLQQCSMIIIIQGVIVSDSEQDQLKQRDQSLRKQEQEMDSLSFRNQQLAKRVELLQEELTMCEAKGKKGKVIQGASTHSVVCHLVVHLTCRINMKSPWS